MWFPLAVSLIVLCALQLSPVGSTVLGEGDTQAASSRLVDAGRGGDVTPGPVPKTRQDKGGLSQGPPFCFWAQEKLSRPGHERERQRPRSRARDTRESPN